MTRSRTILFAAGLALVSAGCVDTMEPVLGARFAAIVAGDIDETLAGPVLEAKGLVEPGPLVDPGGETLYALTLRHRTATGDPGNQIFFAHSGERLEVGEYALSDRPGTPGGVPTVLAVYIRFLDSNRIQLHYASQGTLTVMGSTETDLAAEFSFTVDEAVILNTSIQSGPGNEMEGEPVSVQVDGAIIP
ncbi:MAG: hypothetical protein GWM90_19705 [Gemmatimonadetes bacterium]|nr:hypothetical protein [Gemmatimonadota bacterium]NIQ56656.1 hypothetical protein [Gemmatimonadota bacterium]NIU76845.1 hypothetical protein [Gammaproteobacteria bacterium]NIX46230.1 hypothetical protein [Gemmatimonadota bacterium]NIY10562.1 hypothetical protein [Gemmatimonadota bacterium]